jgi:hypothetical protein
MSKRPLSFDIVKPGKGREPWLRIRARGNRAVLVAGQVYSSADPKHTADLIIEAVLSGDFIIREVSE